MERPPVTLTSPARPEDELEHDLVEYLVHVDLGNPDEEVFDRLAARVFRHQFIRNLPYQRFCRARGITPEGFSSWRQAPTVPTDVFKVVDLSTFPADQTVAIFRTSGTTRGQQRGQHRFSSLRPYEAALLRSFQRYVLPDDRRLPMLSLVAPGLELPDSSLSHMIDHLLPRLGTEGSRSFWRAGSLEVDALTEALEAACRDQRPVLLLGTAFAYVHLFDERPDWAVALPAGSRLMETGGLKGRVREVARDELYGLFETRLGLPAHHCVAEYGMTELSSQLYDVRLRDVWLDVSRGVSQGAPQGASQRNSIRARLEPPPWLKVEVVDPVRLETLPEGTIGLVRFFDLANLNSVCAIQTSDRGRWIDGGLELLGRAPDAEARGCSLTAEEILRVLPGPGHAGS